MKIHFIALGGSIMHSLAIALQQAGHTVSGSDDKIYDPARSRLEKVNLLPAREGWFPERISEDLDAVILGMHAFDDNPELKRAQELGIQIYSFPEFIYEQSKQKHRIVVAGSYGKTTVTSMIMHVLNAAGRDFNYLVGAQLAGFNNPVRLSQDAPTIVMEGDEYLSSKLDPRPKFLLYHPHIAVITGISWDHINVFPTEEIYQDQFRQLIKSLAKAADIVYNESDPLLRKMVDKLIDEEVNYLHPYKTPRYKVKDGKYEVKINNHSRIVDFFGRHNMENMMAAWKVCSLLGVEEEEFLEYISTFKGASSRMEQVASTDDYLVIKDYAHSPDKVKATVEAVKEKYKGRNLIACVELHSFSSLNEDYVSLYKSTMNSADKALVYVNPKAVASRRMDLMSEEKIKSAFARPDILYMTESETLEKNIQNLKTGNDVILMMSSGNFNGLNLNSL